MVRVDRLLNYEQQQCQLCLSAEKSSGTSNQNVQALFTHLRGEAGLNTKLNLPRTDDRDSNRNEINVFESDREIAETNPDAGPAQMTQPMQEIQFFIMRFMVLLTGRNAFAIDF
ncbi:MAG: hypothetical protein EZS28_012657 [Streblomastix strix]|uniref:Uncharacterized protein n=1 Tax=Streblomastix strix TaxID=222440 RepID=A0A5J4WAA2_9EUKA|nr:MAG: hypothetical protein EZS28_012657 [Streblomastix strix]